MKKEKKEIKKERTKDEVADWGGEKDSYADAMVLDIGFFERISLSSKSNIISYKSPTIKMCLVPLLSLLFLFFSFSNN